MMTYSRFAFGFPLVVALVASLGVPLAAQGVVHVGGKVKVPRQTKRVDPVYPEEAKAAGVSGVVILEITVGDFGHVVRAFILRSIPKLDQAALDAVYQWEYEPTLLDGKRVAVVMTVTVNFTLEK
jgi:TonB family protein